MWSILFIAYPLAGLVVLTATPPGRVILQTIKHDALTSDPVCEQWLASGQSWKLRVAQLLVAGLLLLLWPILLFAWLHGDIVFPEEEQTNKKKSPLLAMYDAMDAVCEKGCDTDEIPGGYGEFGYTPTNPVPTRTVSGSN